MDSEFYKKNEVRINEDFQSSRPHYYTSLNSGFKNYFESFLDVKDKIVDLLDFNWTRESIGFDFSIKYDKVVTTIVDFHRFFELLIKDLLRRINPELTNKSAKSPKDFVDSILKKNTSQKSQFVEFSEGFDRLKHICKNLKDYPDAEKIGEFNFLFSDTTLNELKYWRNRLIHNGNKIPNLFSFDFLISQKVIPLVSQVIETEKRVFQKKYEPYYFKTATGINIIEKIKNIKFSTKELKSKPKRKKGENSSLRRKIIELYHLKGIGRAAMNYDRHSKIKQDVYIEYHRLQKYDSHKFIYFQEKLPYFYKTSNCLCCGNPTLATFKENIERKFFNDVLHLVWCHCLVCDYGISNKLGNPKDSKITEQDIFE